LAVISAKCTSAFAEPNSASMPSCSFFSTPMPYSSITAPTVAPNEIGSMPSSLQMKFA